MTKLAVHGTRAPIRAHYLNEEDRSTFRRWAQGCALGYSVVIVALLAVGFAAHDNRTSQAMKQGQAVGALMVSGATAHGR